MSHVSPHDGLSGPKFVVREKPLMVFKLIKITVCVTEATFPLLFVSQTGCNTTRPSNDT
jgi:hypothetical protein